MIGKENIGMDTLQRHDMPALLAAAWDAFNKHGRTKLAPGPAFKEAIEAITPMIAQAEREACIDDCAKVADNVAEMFTKSGLQMSEQYGALEVASAIREIK
jgi:hypothetical protein